MNEIYLDNAATTRPLEEVAHQVYNTMLELYGNPSSLHKKGIEAENSIKKASESMAKMIGCLPEEIIYTSGGTESNNTALMGVCAAYKRRGRKIITTPLEHPSVSEVFRGLEEQGFHIDTVAVDAKGCIEIEHLKQLIDEETILVSIMHVNNEVGAVQDVESIGNLIKHKNKETLFHVDAVQSFGKVTFHVKRSKIDLLSISAHKFYGPRGIGILYKNKTTRMHTLLYGGGQQKNMRSGTQNVPGILGMYTASQYVQEHYKDMVEQYMKCKTYLAKEILKNIPDTFINGPSVEEGAPHILNIRFQDVRAEVLLHALEQKGIYVSSGSACSSHKKTHSNTLAAIGHSGQNLDNALRFSFSYDNTLEEMDIVIEALKEQVALLRRYTLGGKKR